MNSQEYETFACIVLQIFSIAAAKGWQLSNSSCTVKSAKARGFNKRHCCNPTGMIILKSYSFVCNVVNGTFTKRSRLLFNVNKRPVLWFSTWSRLRLCFRRLKKTTIWRKYRLQIRTAPARIAMSNSCVQSELVMKMRRPNNAYWCANSGISYVAFIYSRHHTK